MAIIYPKSASTGTEQCLVLNTREAGSRLFNFSGSFAGSVVTGSWQEIRIGMYLTVVNASVSASSYNSEGPNETATINTPLDWFTFGLKDSESNIVPGYSGSYFIGVGAFGPVGVAPNAVANVQKGANNLGAGGQSNFTPFGTYGSTYITSSTNSQLCLDFPTDPSVLSSYNGLFILRLVLNNSGSTVAPTQSFWVQADSVQPAVGGTLYSTTQLVQDMNTFANSNASQSISWVSGGVALPIPDGFWLRCPLYNNVLRISAVYMKRYA